MFTSRPPKARLALRDRYNSRHNDPTVIKLCQNMRLAIAKLHVKFQLDCGKIKANVPCACVHGFESTRLAVFRWRSNDSYHCLPSGDRTVIKLSQNLRIASSKLHVKIQLDCERIVFLLHVFTSRPPTARLAHRDRYNSRHNDPTVINRCQNVRLAKAKLHVKFQLNCGKINAKFTLRICSQLWINPTRGVSLEVKRFLQLIPSW